MNNNEIKNLNELLDFNTTNKNHILDNLITTENNNTVNNIEITNNVYKDTDIENWGNNLPELCGSKKLILKILNDPINNKELLLKRQSAYINNYDDVCFKILKEYENDI